MPYKDINMQRAAWRKYARKRKRECRKFVQEAKDGPCVDCGVKHPYYVMQFDHVRGNKVSGINAMVASHHMYAIIKEIPKCDLVCANCHAARTFHRGQSG